MKPIYAIAILCLFSLPFFIVATIKIIEERKYIDKMRRICEKCPSNKTCKGLVIDKEWGVCFCSQDMMKGLRQGD